MHNRINMAQSIQIKGYPDTKKIIQVPSVKKSCFCDRDITEKELKNIVTQLRKKQDNRDVQQTVAYLKENGNSIHSSYNGIESKTKVFKNDDGVLLAKWGRDGYFTIDTKEFVQKEKPEIVNLDKSKFDDLGTTIFKSFKSEKIKLSEANNYKLFTKYLNKTFNAYDINSCIRKIHFLAQCYHESGGFIDTYEGENAITKPSGGKDFVGRGIKQISHDYNYLACYDEQERIIHKDSNSTEEFIPLFDIYIKKRDSWLNSKGVLVYQSVTAYFTKYGTIHGFPEDFIEILKDFSKKISTNLKDACMSAGFFWRHQDDEVKGLYEAADADDVKKLTKAINGAAIGLTLRQKYTDDLKIIFDYDNCKKNQ